MVTSKRQIALNLNYQGTFLFKKKDKKETPDSEERPEVVNKEAIA